MKLNDKNWMLKYRILDAEIQKLHNGCAENVAATAKYWKIYESNNARNPINNLD